MATQRSNSPQHNAAFKEEKQYDERVVNIDRVARVVKGGRRFRFRALVVVGDHKGKVGVGSAKGADVTTAISKAVDVAKKDIKQISLYKTTIPHEAETKVSGAQVLIKPASAGTGIIAGGAIRTILEVAGVQDVLSKSIGSSNKLNISYAVLKALESLKPKSEWITTTTASTKDKKAKASKESKS
jgi:small subunit ribosomal protein S5